MNEGEQREFDALKSLNDQSWQEFLEKTKLEWRLSFGLWSVLVTAIASILAGRATGVLITPSSEIIIIIFITVFVLHLWFLYWTQEAIAIARKHLRVVRDEMWERLDLTKPNVVPHEKPYQHPTFYIQIGITTVLIVMLALLLFYSE